MHIKMMTVFYSTLFSLLLGKKRTWMLITPHGQNTLGEILDTTEVIKIAGF